MEAAKSTTTLLLSNLHDPQNEVAWREFHSRYVPIILGVAVRLGLSQSDAADVAQETLACFVRDYRAGKYERDRGRLRSWIIGIVRNRIADLKRKQIARRELRGMSAFDGQCEEDDLAQLWEAEHQEAILKRALEALRTQTRLSERTIRAFELFVLEQRQAAAVAAELGLTAQDVYMAKNRVAERLREIIARFAALYEG